MPSEIPKEIFKAYDIRGVVPDQISTDTAHRIGRAVAYFFQKKLRKKTLSILVCRDVRHSSDMLLQSLIAGLMECGANVVDTGRGTTPFFSFLTHTMGVDGGVMITASHNPAQYNGFKIKNNNGEGVSLGQGLERIQKFVINPPRMPQAKPGKYERSQDTLSAKYINFLLKQTPIKGSRQLRIVADAAGGSGALLLPDLLRQLPNVVYKPLFFEPDGSFQKHSPDPLNPKVQKHIKKEITRDAFDFGFVLDGDGDRILFFDDKGEHVSSEFIAALLTGETLKKKPGSASVFTLDASRAARDFVTERGGEVRLSKVGYTNVHKEIVRAKGIMGSEHAGHFLFKDFFYDDSALFALMRVVALLSQSDTPLSELARPLRSAWISERLNHKVADKEKVLARLESFYINQRAKISRMDGITIEFPEWWCIVRPSNTEPLIRAMVESNNPALLREKMKEIKRLLV